MSPSELSTSYSAKEISSFFNRLVDLIPARYYRPHETTGDPRYMKKAEKAARKEELKVKAKESKKVKLGGVAGEEKTAAAVAGGLDSSSEPHAAAAAPKAPKSNPALLSLPSSASNDLSRDQLQERLKQRLDSLRLQRGQNDKTEAVKKAKDWKQKTLAQNASRLQQGNKNKGQKRPRDDSNQKQPPQGVKKEKVEGSEPNSKAEKKEKGSKDAEAEVGSGFQFPRIEGLDSRAIGQRKPKKPSKEVLLKIAEAKQKAKEGKNEDGKQHGGGGGGAGGLGGKEAQAKDAWKAAALRACGEKVLDDPKLLRKSLKKDQKRREKSAKGWQERKDAAEEKKAFKQGKRRDNIQSRKEGRVEKKKSKREKKLLRAGFEGRKAGFIGEKK